MEQVPGSRVVEVNLGTFDNLQRETAARRLGPERPTCGLLVIVPRTGFITSGWAAAWWGMSSARPAQLVIRAFASAEPVYGGVPRLMSVGYETGSRDDDQEPTGRPLT